MSKPLKGSRQNRKIRANPTSQNTFMNSIISNVHILRALEQVGGPIANLVSRPHEKWPGNFCKFKLLLPESWQYQTNFRRSSHDNCESYYVMR